MKIRFKSYIIDDIGKRLGIPKLWKHVNFLINNIGFVEPEDNEETLTLVERIEILENKLKNYEQH